MIENQNIISDRNMASCGDITFINDTISNNAIVNIHAQDAVYLKPGFHAYAGTNVHITVGGSLQVSPQNSMLLNNEIILEDIFEEPNLLSFTLNNTTISNHNLNFNLYPNPNNGTFQLETNFPLSEIGTLTITNPLGVTIYKIKELVSNTIQLQTSVTGLYFVIVTLKDGSVLTQKMVVQ